MSQNAGFFASSENTEVGTTEEALQETPPVEEIPAEEPPQAPLSTQKPEKKKGLGKTTKIALIAGAIILLLGIAVVFLSLQEEPYPDEQETQAEQMELPQQPENNSDQFGQAEEMEQQEQSEPEIQQASQAESPQTELLLRQIDELESRVSKLEEAIKKKPVRKIVKHKPTAKTETEKPSVESNKTDEVKVEKVVEPEITVAEIPRANCIYLGALNSRAWVSCDETLVTVKKGDMLPYPYGEVESVDDSLGVVTTKGGVIR